jgi:hypothetical protein
MATASDNNASGVSCNVTPHVLSDAACRFMVDGSSHHQDVGPKFFNSASSSLYGSLYPANSPRLDGSYELSQHFYATYPVITGGHQGAQIEKNRNGARVYAQMGHYHQASNNVRYITPTPESSHYMHKSELPPQIHD